MNIGSLERDSTTPAPRTARTESILDTLDVRRRRALQTFILKAEAVGWARIEARKNATKEGTKR